jgi:predicted nucleic acid-binding protein
MPLFLDACAFAKRYLEEGASTLRMREITGRSEDWSGLLVSNYVEPEVVSALAKRTRETSRRIVTPRLLRKHRAAVAAFRSDLSTAAFTIVHVTDALITDAANLLEHRPDYNISAGDALHLATAMEIRSRSTAELVFVTADRRLERAARSEGFVTLNPLHDGAEMLEPMFMPGGDG